MAIAGCDSMWCECCRADVAAELSLDHRRYSCTRCGTDLGHTAGMSGRPTMPRVADSERDARDLLARWSAISVLEPLQHTNVVDTVASQSGPNQASTVRLPAPPAPNPNLIDTIEIAAETPNTESEHNIDRPRRRKRRRRDEASADVVAMHAEPSSPTVRFSWSQLAGHLAAYGGVGLLSVGMTLVIWSYFGGPPAYAPTGWLLTTVGQMLLYLGVVTLVASGLEQTTDAVTLQMRQMGDKLERLEVASRRQSRIMRDAA